MKKNVVLLFAFIIVSMTGCGKTYETSTSDFTFAESLEEERAENKTTEENIEEPEYEEFHSFELVDYAVIVTLMQSREGEIKGCDVLDADGDGMQELFVEKISNDAYPESGAIRQYSVEDYNHPLMQIDTGINALGPCFAEYRIDYDDSKVYFNISRNGQTEFHEYQAWKDGWSEEIGLLDIPIDPTMPSVCRWNGQVVSKDEWNIKSSDFEHRTENLRNNIENVSHVRIQNGNYKQICFDYREHLSDIKVNYTQYTVDIDDDGIEENCYFVDDYVSIWRDQLVYSIPDEGQCFIEDREKYLSLIVIDEEQGVVEFDVTYTNMDVCSMDDIRVGEEVIITNEQDVQYFYEYSKYDGLTFLSKRGNGFIQDMLLNMCCYEAGYQSPHWAQYTFYEDGTVEDRTFMYGSQEGSEPTYYQYEVDEENKKITIYKEGYSTEYTYYEELGVFLTDVIYNDAPFAEGAIRMYMVPCETFPSDDKISEFNAYRYYNL